MAVAQLILGSQQSSAESLGLDFDGKVHGSHTFGSSVSPTIIQRLLDGGEVGFWWRVRMMMRGSGPQVIVLGIKFERAKLVMGRSPWPTTDQLIRMQTAAMQQLINIGPL